MTFRSTLAPAAAALALGFSMSACDFAEDFSGDVDGFIDRVQTDSLDTQSGVNFLAVGVEEQFNDAYDNSAVLADLLSDAFVFDTDVNGSTFPTFNTIDDADIELANNSVDGNFNAINILRFAADDIIRRANETIEFSQDADGTEAKRLALYTGYLYGGIARYFLASYYGLNPNEGGAPLSTDLGALDDPSLLSDIIPSNQLYQLAIDYYTLAKAQVANDYQTRLLNTLIARAHLYRGEAGQAATFAAQGLVMGDAPFTGDFNASSQNNWYTQGGIGRTQVVAADRFQTYQDEGDTRVAVEDAPAVTGATRFYVRQALHAAPEAPLTFASWQETSLIRAEAILASDNGAALSLVNAVRTDASLGALGAVDINVIINERDRTLFTQGQRLMDMRRFNLSFADANSDENSTPIGPWRYLPIPQGERNANPNF